MEHTFLYFYAPIGCVVVTLVFFGHIRNFYAPFYGSVFIEPSTVLEKLVVCARLWSAYFVTILGFCLTAGSFSYIITAGKMLTGPINPEAVRAVIQQNVPSILQVLEGGTLVGIVVVIVTRISATTYSDFLIDYLVFQMLIPINVVLLSFPIILSGPGREFYALLSDDVLRGVSRDLPRAILYASTVSAIVAEAGIEIAQKLGVGTFGSFCLINRLIESHECGERAISDVKVTHIYTGAIRRTINGIGDKQGEGLRTIHWASSTGTPEIAHCLKTEVRAWVGKTRYGIEEDYIRRYDELKVMEDKALRRLLRRKNVEIMLRLLLQRISEQVQSHTKTKTGPSDAGRLLNVEIEDEAQSIIRERVRIITRPKTKERLKKTLTDERIYRTTNTFGNRRFMILNSKRAVVTCPVPHFEDPQASYGSNVGILIEDFPYRIHSYASHFEDWWQQL